MAWVICGLVLAPMSAGAQIVFEREYVNLGRIESAGDLAEAFPFVVRGEGPLEIVDMQSSCGCLSPMLPTRRFAPGQRGELTFGIHATSQSEGKKRYQVSLTWRQGSDVTTTPIIVDLELYKPIVIEPATLLLYVQGDRPIRQTITIKDQRARPLQLRKVAASSEHIQVATKTAQSDPAVRQVELTVAGDFPVGKTQEKIVIRTDDAKNAELVVPITVVRSGRIKILPETLHAGRTKGKPLTWQVLMSDARGEPILIEEIRSSDPAIEVDYPKEATNRCRLKVVVPGSLAASAMSGEISIKLREPIETVLSLPLRVD
jgi:hypothetical protein